MREQAITILQSFGAGLFCGVLFAALKLPIPAPPVIAGIMGIIGIFIGYIIIAHFIK